MKRDGVRGVGEPKYTLSLVSLKCLLYTFLIGINAFNLSFNIFHPLA